MGWLVSTSSPRPCCSARPAPRRRSARRVSPRSASAPLASSSAAASSAPSRSHAPAPLARMSPALVVLAGTRRRDLSADVLRGGAPGRGRRGRRRRDRLGPVAAGVLERALGDAWPGRRWLAATVARDRRHRRAQRRGGGDATASASGILLALASGLAYASYTVIAKRLLRQRRQPGAGDGRGVRRRIAHAAARAADRRSALARTPRAASSSRATWRPDPTVLAYLLFARGLRRLTHPRPRRSSSPSP